MMEGTSSEEMSPLFDGFFAKRILETIRIGGSLNNDGQILFNRILGYLDSIQKGKSQVSSGSLMENAVISINAYSRAMEIASLLYSSNALDEPAFNLILKNVKEEVQRVLHERLVTNLENTYKFFKLAKKLAIEETARNSLARQEVVNWQTPMQF